MNFFKKVKNQNEGNRITSIAHQDHLVFSNWQQVFSACLGSAMVIQNAASELVVKGRDWNVDFAKGIITFGGDEFPIQFIGSEATSSDSWLWGWENVNQFPDDIIRLANETKAFGEKWGLEPLTTAEFALDDTYNGHNLAIVTCGISDENICYYRGAHAGGAILVAFSNLPANVFDPINATQFTSLTMNCIQQYLIDHKIFVESLLKWNGTAFDWGHDKLIAHFKQDLVIEFEHVEEIMRISSIKS